MQQQPEEDRIFEFIE